MKFIVVSEMLYESEKTYIIEADSVEEYGCILRFYKKTGRFRKKMVAKVTWVKHFYPEGTEIEKK